MLNLKIRILATFVITIIALNFFIVICPVHDSALAAPYVAPQIESLADSIGSVVNVPNEGVFVSSTKGVVYKSTDGVTLISVATLGTAKIFLNSDSRGNIYASVDGTGKLYRSSDAGQTWQLIITFPKFGVLEFFNQMADLENGTLVAGIYGINTPWLYRSDNWGVSFYLWVNFTEMFPQYGIYSGTDLLFKHIHSVVYDKVNQKLMVSIGDSLPRLVTSIDGHTWTEEWWTPPISALPIEEKNIILFGDDWLSGGIIRYDDLSKSYNYTWFGYSAGFGTAGISGLVYKNGVVYAVGRNDTAEVHRQYIMASPDYGESWVTLFQSSEGVYDFPQIAVVGDYVYATSAQKLYRFEAFSSADQLIYLLAGDESGNSTLFNNSVTYLSFSDTVIKNPVLRIEQHSVFLNLLPNPSLALWKGQVPDGWTLNEAAGGSVAKTEGLYGVNAAKIIKNGIGGYKLRTDFINASAQDYLVGGYVKTNSTIYSPDLRPTFRVDFYNQTGYLGSASFSYRTANLAVNQWQRIWWVLQAPTGVTNITRILFYFGAYCYGPVFAEIDFDSVFCVPLGADKVDGFSALNALPEVPAAASTMDGSLAVNDEKVYFSSDQLPFETPLSQMYLYGIVRLQLNYGFTVSASISGDEVLKLNNSVIETKTNGVYVGRWYDGFEVISNEENATVVLHDSGSNILNASLINQHLDLLLDISDESRMFTKVYSLQKPIVVTAYGIPLSPDVDWTWNPDSKILSITASCSKGQMPLKVYYALIGANSVNMEKAQINENENATLKLTINTDYEFPASMEALVKNNQTGDLVGRIDDFSPIIPVGEYNSSLIIGCYQSGNYTVDLVVTDKLNNVTILSTTLSFTVTSSIQEFPVLSWLVIIGLTVVIAILVASFFFFKRQNGLS
jgi:hypothetical protein